MEIVTPPSSPRQAKDRWCSKALRHKFSKAPNWKELTDYKFSDDFTPLRLKAIKNEAGRGFAGRLGSFKAVVEQAETTNKLFIAYTEGKKFKKGPLSKKSDVTAPQLIAQFEQLIRDADEWRGHFDEDGQRQQTGKLSDTTVEPDKHRKAKLRACEDMIRGAHISIAQIKLQEFDATDGESQVELARQLDAEVLQTVCGVKVPTGGTSEVSLIKAPDGSIAYAFKSIDGESEQTGLPKGAGAVRELMMSRLCDQVKDSQKLDFGWPKTTMATMKDGKGTKQQGVLVEGIPGDVPYLDDPEGDPNERQRNLRETREMLQKLPPRDIQKLALCNLAFGQYDIKWDNAIVQQGDGDDDDDGGNTVAPFDGGAAFPTMNLFMETVGRGAVPGATLTQYGDRELEVVHGGKKTPVGETPMDPGLVKMFLSMDEDALEKTAQLDLQALASQGLDPEALGMNDGVKIMVGSIRGIKKLLRENPLITMDDFLTLYQSKVMKGMAKDFHDDWEMKLRGQYAELQKKHPALLPVDGSRITPQDLSYAYVSPMGREILRNIETLGGAEFLRQPPIGAKVPLAITPRQVWINFVLKSMPKTEQQKYPQIFKNL